MMFWTWVRSVLGVMNSRSQISGRGRGPSVSARRTSSSRGVSVSTGVPLGLAVAGLGDPAGDRRRSPTAAGGSRRRARRGPRRDHVLERPVLGQVAVGAGLDGLEDASRRRRWP